MKTTTARSQLDTDAEWLRLAVENVFEPESIYCDKTLRHYMALEARDAAKAAFWRESLSDEVDREFRRRLSDLRKLKTNGAHATHATGGDLASEAPNVIDLRSLATTEPEPPRSIMDGGGMPEGDVTLAAGHGGTGKSQIYLYLGVCISLAKPFFGIRTSKRPVLFVSLEDGVKVLHWRLRRICDWLGVSMESLAGQLTIIDGSRAEASLMTETRDGLEITPTYTWLKQQIKDSGAKVLILDGASDSFDADENRRRSVRKFIRTLRKLIPADGACLVLAHVDKATARNSDTTQGYSGSTAWSNSVRARWFLSPDVDDSLVLELQKSNYGQTGSQIRLRWNPSAHLFLGELTMPTSKLERELAESDEREAVLGLIRTAQQHGNPIPAACAGSRTSWHVLSAMPGFPNSLTGKSGRARLFAVLETLQAARVLTRTTEKYGQRNSREVLYAA